MRIFLNLLGVALICLGFTACRSDESLNKRTSNFEEFIARYNTYIKGWLEEQAQITSQEVAETVEQLETAEGEAREELERTVSNLEREQEKWEYRQSLEEYFRFKEPNEIPDDLVWEDGSEHEEIGDSRAEKGGTFTREIPSFPPTIRLFGDNSNNGFRSYIYDDILMVLVDYHPKSMEMIPGIAKRWAVSEDGRTVYYEIHEDACYSDGVPIRAKDFMFGAYVRISDDIVEPFFKQVYREAVAGMTTYGDKLLAIHIPEAQVYAPAGIGSLRPAPPHFYEEYGPDFAERYQWKFPPTTGAYEVREDDIVKGVSITQTRVKDWWAKDLKYYRYRYNVDRIRNIVVRDDSKAFELFRAGEIDSFYLSLPKYWYEKTEIDPVFDGYIERYTFYNQYPDIPRGLWLNVTKPLLDEKQIRIGIQHAMNWQKVIDVMFRGDFQRLNSFQEGFGPFSDPTIKARPYSISAARAAFREAGFTETARDGILRRPDGTRLSVALSYSAHPELDTMFSILKEEAKACGFDLRMDSNESVVSYKKMMQKQHEMAYAAWGVNPPSPDYYQYLHSSNARDARGNIKPQTNNLFVWSRQDTDTLCEKARNARTEEELIDANLKLQNIVHDEAIFVPAYTVDFKRMGSWRWVCWPDSETTRFSPPVIYEPLEEHVHWIDQKKKKETLAAMKAGKVFPEVNRVFDDYRYTDSEEAEKMEELLKPAEPDQLLESEVEQ